MISGPGRVTSSLIAILKSDYRVNDTRNHRATNYRRWLQPTSLLPWYLLEWATKGGQWPLLKACHYPQCGGAHALIILQTNKKTTERINSSSHPLFPFFTIASWLHHLVLCQMSSVWLEIISELEAIVKDFRDSLVCELKPVRSSRSLLLCASSITRSCSTTHLRPRRFRHCTRSPSNETPIFGGDSQM